MATEHLTFLTHASYERLLTNINSNHHRYVEPSGWLPSYFSSGGWSSKSNTVSLSPFQLVAPSAKLDFSDNDLENTRIVFTALRHLTPLQAADARLWAYHSHVDQWEYMRKRWPVEQYLGKPRFREIVQERYLFMPDRSRALIRNGIARLWWYGYCSFDESRSDPFELTAVLLKNLDVTQSILERAFSRNLQVTRAVLTVLHEREQNGKAFYVRDKVRDLAKYIVQIGGVTIVDALDQVDLRSLVEEKIDELAAA